MIGNNSRRDLFAAAALTGFLAHGRQLGATRSAWDAADQMLEAEAPNLREEVIQAAREHVERITGIASGVWAFGSDAETLERLRAATIALRESERAREGKASR